MANIPQTNLITSRERLTTPPTPPEPPTLQIPSVPMDPNNLLCMAWKNCCVWQTVTAWRIPWKYAFRFYTIRW